LVTVALYRDNNQALVDREGTFILLSASHSTRVSTPTVTISSSFYMSMVSIWMHSFMQSAA